MFRLRALILNQNLLIYIDLKLVISKILSIVFIVATLLLSHINFAFQSTSVRPNLSESLSKHEDYEYTNLIFRKIIHLF